MAGGSFDSMVRFAGFFLAIWGAGKIAKVHKISSILPELAVGMILGPELLGFVKPQYTRCDVQRQMEECKNVPWDKQENNKKAWDDIKWGKDGKSMARVIYEDGKGKEKCGDNLTEAGKKMEYTWGEV